MPRTVTITFEDGRKHIYNGVPDAATPEDVMARAAKEFQGAKVVNIDGGRGAAPEAAQVDDPGFGQAALIGVGRTADRLAKGVKQMGLNVVAPFSDSAKGELDRMAQTEAENSRLYQKLQDIRPGATMLGEAAPLVAAPMLGAGAMATAASAALPGLVEYGTGQERLARGAMGAAGGWAGRTAGNMIARAVKPTQALTGAQQGAIEAADRLGVKLTAGEASGNRALRWAEAASSDMPIAAGIASRRIAGNDKALAQAAARSIGQRADELSGDVFSAARQEISGKFDALLKPVQIDLGDKAIQHELSAVTGSKVLKSLRDDGVEGIIAEIKSIKGPVSGEWFQQNKTALDAAIRANYNSGKSDVARALEGVEKALDRAARKSMGEDGAKAYDLARKQWANLRMLETGKVVENGRVMPGRLDSALTSRYKGAYKEGKIGGDLADIAKLAGTLRGMPQSGTAPRAIYGGMAGGVAMAEPTTAAAMIGVPTALQAVAANPMLRNYMTRGLVNLTPEAEAALLRRGARLGLLGAYGASQ